MTDLDTLRPEVRDALMHIRPDAHRFEINSWNCIRAELLRLSEDAAKFAHAVSLEQRYKQRADEAEAELAALRARIADALIADVRRAPSGLGRVEVEGLPHDWIDKRVRLVEME